MAGLSLANRLLGSTGLSPGGRLSAGTGLYFGGFAFSPASLFAAGEQGVWYDPSDLTTLFQDSAGVTPVTAVEQPVGLMLDKSKGLTLGSELVTNGNPFVGASWSGSTGNISGGKLVWNAVANASGIFQSTAQYSGGAYEISVVVSSITSGAVTVTLGIGSPTSSNCVNITSAGTYTFKQGNVSGDTFLRIYSVGASTTATIDSVSVKRIAGNHAAQTTDPARPRLSALVNLLTKTEQFNDAAWTKAAGVSVTPNTHVAPDGTLTADTLISTQNQIDQTTTVAQNILYTNTLYFRKTTGAAYQPGMYLLFSGGTLVIYAVRLNTDTGVGTAVSAAGFTAPSSFSVTEVGDYWRLSITGNSNNNTTGGLRLYANLSAAGGAFAGTQIIWGADLRATNDGVGLPVYQRVNTSTDYDTTGFPLYLRFDGTDDSMATGSISFTSTDKMTVFGGVRKLTSASDIICELNVNQASAGSFYFTSGIDGAFPDAYQFLGKGTATVGSTQVAYVSPALAVQDTSVIAATGDISGDLNTIRRNTVLGVNATGDQGSGNYGNWPLYIGARGGTTILFNGRIYSLIVRGAASTAQQISDTETWVNGKTKAFA